MLWVWTVYLHLVEAAPRDHTHWWDFNVPSSPFYSKGTGDVVWGELRNGIAGNASWQRDERAGGYVDLRGKDGSNKNGAHVQFGMIVSGTRMSAAALVRLRWVGTYSRVFDMSNGPNEDNIILSSPPTTEWEAITYDLDDGMTRITGSEVPFDRWFHVVFVTSPPRTELYVNGELLGLEGTRTTPGIRDIGRGWNYLFRSAWDTHEAMEGYVGDFRLFDYGLSRENITLLYKEFFIAPANVSYINLTVAHATFVELSPAWEGEGTPQDYSIASLPAGLSIDANNGTISGYPVVSALPLTVQACNLGGCVETSLAIHVVNECMFGEAVGYVPVACDGLLPEGNCTVACAVGYAGMAQAECFSGEWFSLTGCDRISDFCPRNPSNSSAAGACPGRHIGSTCAPACNTTTLLAPWVCAPGARWVNGTVCRPQSLPCPEHCLDCTATGTCLECALGWEVSSGACVCPPGHVQTASSCEALAVEEEEVSEQTAVVVVAAASSAACCCVLVVAGAIMLSFCCGGLVGVYAGKDYERVILNLDNGEATVKFHGAQDNVATKAPPVVQTGCFSKFVDIDAVLDTRGTRLLGAGGAGAVYSGTVEGRRVAIKILLSDDDISEFYNEARVLSSLTMEPWSVELLHFCPVKPAIVLSHCSSDLHTALHVKTALPWADRLQFVFDTARALDALHQRGVAHLDIKPKNVLLNGRMVKLADYGTALAGNDWAPTVFCGTLQYASPERFDLPSCRTRTQACAADAFSLGVLAWECASLRRPFYKVKCARQIVPVFCRGNSDECAAVLQRHLALARVSDAGARAAIALLLTASPANRATIPAFLDALESANGSGECGRAYLDCHDDEDGDATIPLSLTERNDSGDVTIPLPLDDV